MCRLCSSRGSRDGGGAETWRCGRGRASKYGTVIAVLRAGLRVISNTDSMSSSQRKRHMQYHVLEQGLVKHTLKEVKKKTLYQKIRCKLHSHDMNYEYLFSTY
jgi:hypothetical protein